MRNDEPYWLTRPEPLPPLASETSADAVIIGGGIAGLTVAQLLAERGVSAVLLERDTCGSGATGRSSGFMTPDSELQVTQLSHRYGDEDGAMLWRAASEACEHVRATLEREQIDCDYLPCDSFYAEIGGSSARKEHEARRRLGLESRWCARDVIPIGGGRFEGGVRYGGTLAITPHRYALGLRDRLRDKGVRIYERTEVRKTIPVRAKMTFFCADHDLARLGDVRSAAYHAQTFLAATPPLPASRLDALFPDGNLIVWDTGLMYHYFRRTGDDRFLLGGGLLRTTYAPPSDPNVIVDDFREYMRERLPAMADVEFSNIWSGMIGVTKDFLPLAGRDAENPAHFYAGCGAGIPWSVLAARCAVEAALDGDSALQRFFDPRRRFTLDRLQPVLRKPATFALSHALVKSS